MNQYNLDRVESLQMTADGNLRINASDGDRIVIDCNQVRLEEVTGTLGLGGPSSAETDSRAACRRAILADLKAGRITSEEALAALNEAAKPNR